ncbi:unnamed protein product [Caenorhabditis nigoni]
MVRALICHHFQPPPERYSIQSRRQVDLQSIQQQAEQAEKKYRRRHESIQKYRIKRIDLNMHGYVGILLIVPTL